jgi:chromosome segregation ATPase
MSMELEKELQTDVGENGGVGIVRKKPMRALRAAPPGSGASLQPAPLTSSEVKAVVEDKKLEADTFSGIARLKQELAALKRACGASDEALAAKDQQIKDLMAHLARLDQDLAKELQKEEVLAKQLADEKRKESELEAQIVQDRQVFATEEELIADLKKRLADALKKNDSCDDLIASLRKQLAALELGRDYAKVSDCKSDGCL